MCPPLTRRAPQIRNHSPTSILDYSDALTIYDEVDAYVFKSKQVIQINSNLFTLPMISKVYSIQAYKSVYDIYAKLSNSMNPSVLLPTSYRPIKSMSYNDYSNGIVLGVNDMYDLCQLENGSTGHYKYLACNMPRCLLVQDILTMAPTSIKRIFIGCANALNTFHKLGAIHRDIKLSNFVHARDGVKLIDFDTVTFLTTDGLVGTPMYFSKEYIQTEVANQASDVWALGISLLSFFASEFNTSAAALVLSLFQKSKKSVQDDFVYLHLLSSINYDHVSFELLKQEDWTPFAIDVTQLIFKHLLCRPEVRSIDDFIEQIRLLDTSAQ